MGTFLPSTKAQQNEMLKEIGVSSFEDLYNSVPNDILLKENQLKLPSGVSEMEAASALEHIASKNKVYSSIFRGAGAYHHYIPSIVKRVIAKEQFLTAYTPYQAEISQGVLQSIFEYQSMICALTGMDVANASVYDGATAAAEATEMCRDRKRNITLIAESVQPEILETVKTYCWGHNAEVITVPAKNGVLDLDQLKNLITDKTASFCFQQPNFFGNLENAEEIISLAHEKGAKVIMSVNPISLGILKTPGELGADIAVGDGQPLGMPIGFGGPFLGFMATNSSLVRKLPGRIVGQTKDNKGNRCYVLTLQAREQHIRREKASSNICSNQALCAMAASVYMASMGPAGMQDVANLCYNKAHYLADELSKIGYNSAYDASFFNEFVTNTPIASDKVLEALDGSDILGGLPVSDGILWCCTEMNTKEQIDELISVLKEVRE